VFFRAVVVISAPSMALVTGATVSGTVPDPGGAGVPAASIAATNTLTGVVSRTVSDSSGAYVMPSLPPGTYSVSIEKAGFKTRVLTGITLQVAQQATVNVPLEIGEVTTTIDVSAQAPMVESANASVGTVIETQQVTE